MIEGSGLDFPSAWNLFNSDDGFINETPELENTI